MRERKANVVNSRMSPTETKAASIRLASPGVRVLSKTLSPWLSGSVQREVLHEESTHERGKFEMML